MNPCSSDYFKLQSTVAPLMRDECAASMLLYPTSCASQNDNDAFGYSAVPAYGDTATSMVLESTQSNKVIYHEHLP